MSNVIDTLGAAGPGEMFEAEGQAWFLTPLGPGIRARFSAWCKMRARKEVGARKAYLSSEEYREDLANLDERIAAGAYNWNSPFHERRMGTGVQVALDEEEGQAYLTALMLEKAHGLMPLEKVAALILAGGDSFQAAWRAAMGLAPNRPAPATQKEKPGMTTTKGSPVPPA